MASHSETVKEPRKTLLKALRVSRGAHLPLAAACSLGLLLSITPPLLSANASSLYENQTLEKAPPAQTLKVSSVAKAPALARDGYSATSQAELDAMRAAEAEAARVAEEAAKAAADAAAEAQREQNKATLPASSKTGGYIATPPTTSYSGQAIVDYAEQFVGVVPYGYGNDPSDSFSCDGLTQYVFGQFGISLGRGVGAQSQQGVQVSADQAQAGDLVIWPGEHVGIYDGHGGIIHSPDFGRMVTHASSLWGSYYFLRVA